MWWLRLRKTFKCAPALGDDDFGGSAEDLYGDAGDGDIDLTEAADRERRLEDFVAMLRSGVLPWFAEEFYLDGVAAARSGQPDPGRWTVNTAAALGWSVTRLTRA